MQVEKFSYALGLSLASNMLQSGIKVVDYQSIFAAIQDVFDGKPMKMTADEANQIITEHFKNQQSNLGAINQREGQAFLDENSKIDGVVTLSSGLQYTILTAGNGQKPAVTDKVKCHYHGTLIDGTVFDSSVKRDQPAVFPVNGVIQGWVEALQLMEVGAKWRLFIPSNLAYGDQGAGGVIGPNSTLIFDVELLEIM